MEIITMESSAYKELVEKIDKIAGYVCDSEREKKQPDADVWPVSYTHLTLPTILLV